MIGLGGGALDLQQHPQRGGEQHDRRPGERRSAGAPAGPPRREQPRQHEQREQRGRRPSGHGDRVRPRLTGQARVSRRQQGPGDGGRGDAVPPPDGEEHPADGVPAAGDDQRTDRAVDHADHQVERSQLAADLVRRVGGPGRQQQGDERGQRQPDERDAETDGDALLGLSPAGRCC
ncbi:hypothetical protein [Nocardioides sp. TF02-7]|uniref:hypothetical protein n=1 Tax=Nocardioides sp. TF02-7 TaxID=2917724 RepID=UPI001F06304C|nr:hypothetical protein [Nocardioides sp. TF02-7]UMG93771.1 hypothetical protein MF408_06340 [Nocardioides sp. TF02-7]